MKIELLLDTKDFEELIQNKIRLLTFDKSKNVLISDYFNKALEKRIDRFFDQRGEAILEKAIIVYLEKYKIRDIIEALQKGTLKHRPSPNQKRKVTMKSRIEKEKKE